MPNDDVDSYLKGFTNKNEDKEELKTKSQVVGSDMLMSLNYNHELNKDKVIEYALKLFISHKAYEYSCLCEVCKGVVKLEHIPLYCGCTWTKLGKKIKVNNDLAKVDCGKCSKGHPLTSIDLGLVNDFISFKFTSWMISDYLKDKEELANPFSESIKRERIEDIAWILRCIKAVTNLDLSNDNIGYEGGKAIGEALKSNTTLTKVYLSNNRIGDEGDKAIGEALKGNTTLTKVYLSNNNIGYEGGKAIGEALKSNTTLTNLYLSNNNIGYEGDKAIGEALKSNTTLTKVYLSNNNIGYEGGKAIGEALKGNTTLTNLYLSNNKIGYEGDKAIGEALKGNTTLTNLYLSDNKIGDEGGKAIDERLKNNTTLTNSYLNTLILLPMIGSPLYIIIYIVPIITYILYHKPYEYSYLCEICKRVVKLKCIPLYCVCI